MGHVPVKSYVFEWIFGTNERMESRSSIFLELFYCFQFFEKYGQLLSIIYAIVSQMQNSLNLLNALEGLRKQEN